MISRCQDDQQTMSLMLSALESVLRSGSERVQDEAVFTCLEQMVHLATDRKVYAKEVVDQAVDMALSLKVADSDL